MPDRYSWQDSKSETTYRSSNQDHLGWWAAAAMLVSILLHVIVFFALDQVKFALGIKDPPIVTGPVTVNRSPDQIPQDFTPTLPPENFEPPPPPQDTAKLLEDIDLLSAVKDQEVEMKPEIVETTVAIMPSNPAASGDPDAVVLEVSSGLDLSGDLPEFGRSPSEMRPAAVGQLTIDPGSMKADDTDLTKFTENLRQQGANGRAEKGSLDGLTSLDEMVGLPSNKLLGATTMLPSDLLFEFNRYEVRESAKFDLQKLGIVLDKNPTWYCWIEGHTDLIGNDSANLELSLKRAEAVKSYLVNSMKFDPEKIIARGFGRFEPIVTSGDKDQQAPNRRVEIKIRKTPPTEDQIKISPPKASAVEEEMPPPPRPEPIPAPPAPETPPKAVMVRPNPERAKPVEIVEMPETTAPKARAIQDTPPPPMRARPVAPEPAPVRAIPVQEEEEPGVLKAQPVEE